MAETFNDLLRDAGIDPSDVRLLRHTTKPKHGKTLFEFRRDEPSEFERYQQTQERGKPLFETSKFWASFVVSPSDTTIFVGLYRVTHVGREDESWIDPYTKEKPGHENGKSYDFYETVLCTQLSEFIDKLEIEWDRNSAIAWARYGDRVDWPIRMHGEIASDRFVDQFDLTDEPIEEVKRRLNTSNNPIRNPNIRRAALIRADGKCEYCGEPGFAMSGGRVYLETHHIIPFSEGGFDVVANVVALCPNHHREAHYGIGAVRLRREFQIIFE